MKKKLSFVITIVTVVSVILIGIFSLNVSAAEEDYILEAAEELRSAMVARRSNIVISIETDNFDNNTSISKIINEALRHTGVPYEGDYIRANMLGYRYTLTTWTDENGTHRELSISFNWLSTPEMEEEVNAAVDSLLAELDLWEETEYRKIKGLYTWVCENVAYDYGLDDPDNDSLLKHSTYAALIYKEAVCQGYASLFYRLCLEMGIDCRYITGMSDEEPHAWNITRLNDVYYNMDATWDGGCSDSFRYFLCTNDNFAKHTRNTEYNTADFNEQYPMATLPYVTVSGTINSKISWVLDGDTGTLTVTGTGAIPSYCFDDPPWSNYRDNVKSIVISEGITEIDNMDFSGTALTEITIPSTITSIGEAVFENCPNVVLNVCCGSVAETYAKNNSMSYHTTHTITITEVVSPTTQAEGYTLYTCIRCGHSYKDNFTDRYIAGDIDSNEGVNKDDAIYLLRHVFSPTDYPVEQDCDFDKDGTVDKNDAIYLLRHTFLPEEYPLEIVSVSACNGDTVVFGRKKDD